MNQSTTDLHTRLALKRHHYFVLSIFAAFLLPLALSATSFVFTFAVLITLVAWFMIRWESVARLVSRPKSMDYMLGGILLVANIFRNLLSFPEVSFGLFDMLVSFISISIIFYGIRGLRRLWVPAMYILVLVIAYQLEFVSEEVEMLEYSLAKFMSFTMGALGIKTNLLGNVVQVFTPSGNYFLEIAGPCTGVKGMLAYGSLAVLVLLEEKASLTRKAIFASIGLLGTFLVNLLRLIAIFLAIYTLGIDAGLFIHSYMGYTFFILWMFLFWTIAFKNLAPKAGRPTEAQGYVLPQSRQT